MSFIWFSWWFYGISYHDLHLINQETISEGFLKIKQLSKVIIWIIRLIPESVLGSPLLFYQGCRSTGWKNQWRFFLLGPTCPSGSSWVWTNSYAASLPAAIPTTFFTKEGLLPRHQNQLPKQPFSFPKMRQEGPIPHIAPQGLRAPKHIKVQMMTGASLFP